jgi:hypothetical protein
VIEAYETEIQRRLGRSPVLRRLQPPVQLRSALLARAASPGLRLLTLDQRLRENGERLGLAPLP